MRQILLALVLAPFLSIAQSDIVPGIIILKVKPEYKSELAREGVRWDAFEGLDLLKIEMMFPRAEEPMGRTDRNGHPFADLTRTYKLTVDESEDLAVLIEKLSASNRFDWVEPTSYSISDATPNDPNIGSQNYLTQIGAFAAWDVTTGDTNVVIGVTDTSFDLLHQDLQGNLKRNYADPVNGQDDDLDGLIDNYAGWDIESDDNQLFVSGNYHGTGVLAVSSATTNNGVGIAGVGYNCKYLPVKIGSSAGTIVTADGYEAIIHCADRDCKVINCSWGSTIFSNLGVDAVNYATINKDALVVASAGNLELEEYRYPASYNYAISVTGVHNTDVFDNGTNPTFTWADSVDLCAQGFDVYSTATGGGTPGTIPVYQTTGGTSFAAPQVSGAAALVRSQFPCLSAIETAELLIDNAVDIESIGTNGDFAGKIGKRLDVGATLNIAINPCDPVGIANPQDDLAITVYPNPSAGNATLVVSAMDVWNVQVFSARGEKVMQAQFTGNTHHIQGLADGLYLITLSNGKQTHTQRLVVIGNR
jgi:serine protease